MKTCHLIWNKHKPMSWLQSLTVRSFFKYNPDWEIVVHLITNRLKDNIWTKDYDGEDFFDLVKLTAKIKEVEIEGDFCSIQASDILRMKILFYEGGVYSDFDMLWLKPMSEFPKDFETTVCYYPGQGAHFNMSNIVSEPGGGFLKEIIEKQKKVRSKDYQAYLTEMLNKEYTPEEIIRRFPRVLMIPYEWFYPYSIYELDTLYDCDIDLTKNAFGLHWFNGHPMSQDYIKRMQDCSMTSILRREGYL